MCSRICDGLSRGASFVWDHFLADDCTFLAQKAADVWEVMRFRQPDPNADRTYIPLNGGLITLSKITKVDEIAFQLEVSKETQNWSKRWARTLVTTGGAVHFLLNPSFYGAIWTGATAYMVIKAVNKGIDMWHAGTEKFNRDRLKNEYARLIAAASLPAAAAHAGSPP